MRLGYLVPKLLPRSPRLSLPTITMLTKTSVTVIKVITTTITLAMGKVEVEAAREDSIDRDLLLKGKPSHTLFSLGNIYERFSSFQALLLLHP